MAESGFELPEWLHQIKVKLRHRTRPSCPQVRQLVKHYHKLYRALRHTHNNCCQAKHRVDELRADLAAMRLRAEKAEARVEELERDYEWTKNRLRDLVVPRQPPGSVRTLIVKPTPLPERPWLPPWRQPNKGDKPDA